MPNCQSGILGAINPENGNAGEAQTGRRPPVWRFRKLKFAVWDTVGTLRSSLFRNTLK
jgi:hypothetical protein